ncbi:MAG: hypothetical protein IKD87_08260 [Oscillospiraceae bacterium]|nr:hypothetical protein [Oscillospiraceae bacterium]
MSRKTVRKKEDTGQIAGKVALVFASSFALAAISVACVAAIYAKALTDVRYIGDDDVYEED